MGRNVNGLKKALKNITGQEVKGNSKGEVFENFNKLYLDVSAALVPSSGINWGNATIKAKARANQDAVALEQNGVKIAVSGKLSDLQSYASSNQEQGTAKWVGILVDTGTDDITGVKYNGSLFTADDVTEASSLGAGAGKFVLWIKADVVVSTPKTFTLSAEGKNVVEYTVTFTDVA